MHSHVLKTFRNSKELEIDLEQILTAPEFYIVK